MPTAWPDMFGPVMGLRLVFTNISTKVVVSRMRDVLAHRHIAGTWLVLGIMLSLPPLFIAMDHDAIRSPDPLMPLPVLYRSLVGQAVVGIMVTASAILSLRKKRTHGALVVASVLAAAFGAVTSLHVLLRVRLPFNGYAAVACPAIILIACAVWTFVGYVKAKE